MKEIIRSFEKVSKKDSKVFLSLSHNYLAILSNIPYLVAFMPLCLHVHSTLSALVPRALIALVPHVPRVLRAPLPNVLRALHVFLSHVLSCLM